jgi:hypothetical protein
MYEPPQVEELGTLAELTQDKNKVGHTPDMFSAVTGIVGSIVSI